MRNSEFEQEMRELRREFQKNVIPVIKRHSFYLTRSERARGKHDKAVKRLKRLEQRRRSGGYKKRSSGKGNQGFVRFKDDGKRRLIS